MKPDDPERARRRDRKLSARPHEVPEAPLDVPHTIISHARSPRARAPGRTRTSLAVREHAPRTWALVPKEARALSAGRVRRCGSRQRDPQDGIRILQEPLRRRDHRRGSQHHGLQQLPGGHGALLVRGGALRVHVPGAAALGTEKSGDIHHGDDTPGIRRSVRQHVGILLYPPRGP